MKLHKLPDAEHFKRLLHYNVAFIRDTVEKEESGSIKDLRYARVEVMRRYLSNGCIALILGQSDDEARRNFTAAVEYALRLVKTRAPAGRSMHSYEAHVRVSEVDGSTQLTALHEKKPLPGSEKLSITDYHRALMSVVCFGERAQFGGVASVPEESYRNPGTLARADYWAHLRAWKAWLQGDPASAEQEARAATSAPGVQDVTQSESAGMLAVIAGDSGRLHGALETRLKLHQKHARKEPNSPLSVVCFPGLMLCRMALDAGLAVEEDVYLPLRLLPKSCGAATH